MAETEENEQTADEIPEENEKTAEELEEEAEGSPDDDRADVNDAFGVLERELEPLQDGKTVDSPVGQLPTRFLVGMALMVAVFVVVYFIAWSLFGGAGLAFGWVLAGALGLLAAREYGRRKASS